MPLMSTIDEANEIGRKRYRGNGRTLKQRINPQFVREVGKYFEDRVAVVEFWEKFFKGEELMVSNRNHVFLLDLAQQLRFEGRIYQSTFDPDECLDD